MILRGLLLVGLLWQPSIGSVAGPSSAAVDRRAGLPLAQNGLDARLAALRTVAAALPRGRGSPTAEIAAQMDALAGMPPQDLRELLEALMAAGPDDRERRLALELLRLFAGPGDVSLAIGLATPPTPDGHVARAVLDALEDLLADLHQSGFSGTHAVAQPFLQLDRTLQAVTLRAVQRTSGTRTIAFLEDFLGRDEVLDRSLLVPLARHWARSPAPPRNASLVLVRGFLSSRDDATRREAALAIGWMDDEQAVEQLVAVLEDPHPPVRDAALWSLRRLSGLRMRACADLWQRWLTQSRHWWDEGSEEAFDALAGGDITAFVHALNEVGGQRLRRRMVAQRVLLELRREEPVLVGLVCAALEQIGSPVAVPALVDLLMRDDPAVHGHALRVLRRLTGQDLPADYSAWRAWLAEA